MARIVLKGMNWSHRRAVDPMLAASKAFAAQTGIEIEWDARSLAGFEFTSVSDLATQYDMIVFDHPFCGVIAGSGSLVGLTGILGGTGANYVGKSLASYDFAGEHWAAPVDAATQVQIVRPDLAAGLGLPVPARWHEVMELGRAARQKGWWLAVAFKGVHSLMTFFSLNANLGTPCAVDVRQPLCDRRVAAHALELMRELLAYCPPEVLDWNAIDVHEQMVARDDLVLCPAVYFYATYAENDMRRPLQFHDFPGPNGCAGTTLGGAGLGVSNGPNSETARLFARYVIDPGVQKEFAHHHGQPALRAAWNDADINAKFASGFSNTLATHEQAWVRPRYSGYLDFQRQAGEAIEAHLRGAMSSDDLIELLLALPEKCARPNASG